MVRLDGTKEALLGNTAFDAAYFGVDMAGAAVPR